MTPIRLDDLIDGIRGTYPDQPLDQLTAAVLAAEQLSEVSDHLIGHFVDQARHSGASWTEIGGCLGVTKQAAQQRFVAKQDQNVFTRFTAKARQTVMQAQEEARAGGYPQVAPEHLLLGLLSVPDSIAIRVLSTSGVDADDVREAVASNSPARTGRGGATATDPVLRRGQGSPGRDGGAVRAAGQRLRRYGAPAPGAAGQAGGHRRSGASPEAPALRPGGSGRVGAGQRLTSR